MAVFSNISYWLVLSFGELTNRRSAGDLNQASVILKTVLANGLWTIFLMASPQACL